jgi:hypothetical protein
MNILCMGGRTVGPEVAWDLSKRTWRQSTAGSNGICGLQRLGKVALLEDIDRRAP